MRRSLGLFIFVLAACSSPGGPYPSLRSRPAEKIDPRVAVERPFNQRPAAPALVSRLALLVEQARIGDSAFGSAAVAAERLAMSAGAAQSESWIDAQEALTAAIAARKQTTTALADIDELGAAALQTQGGIAPNDLAAIDRAASEIAAMDQREADRLQAIQSRLNVD